MEPQQVPQPPMPEPVAYTDKPMYEGQPPISESQTPITVTTEVPKDYPIKIARDSKGAAPDKVYVLMEKEKVKFWIPDPQTLKNGEEWWGDFGSVEDKDLSSYTDGRLSMIR